jgi:uncharacterized protein with ParB-like and HNH nuclease domain
MSVQSIINQIKENEIVLPAIQRSFVWEEEKILRLLDSIMRKYPIGLVLLWETYNDIQFRFFGSNYRKGDIYYYQENSNNKKLKLVLDGQQRLQSLYLALYGTYNNKCLYFDILSGKESDNKAEVKYKFEFFGSEDARKSNDLAKKQLSLSNDSEDISYFIKASDLFVMSAKRKIEIREELKKEFKLGIDDSLRLETNLSKFNEVFSQDENILRVAVIDENLPGETGDRKSEADVLEIFVRVNREGTPLNRSDLIFSILKLNWKEAVENLPTFVLNINKGNSLNIDTDFVIRCLFAVSDLGTKFDVDLLRNKNNVELIKENFEKCCNAIRSTVDFVQQQCWCQNDRVIGGCFTMIPFVYYLFNSRKHEIKDDQLDNARKSFFLFAFAKPFSRYADSRIGAFIRHALKPLIEKNDEIFPYKRSIEDVKYWEKINSIEELIDKNDLLALHLVQGLTGAKVQYENHSPEIDHIFPRSELREKGVKEEMINHFANFWILTRGKNRNKSNQHPAKYFSDIDSRMLKEALIDSDLLDYRRFSTFIEKRKQLIINKIIEKIGISEADFRVEKDEES